MPTKRKVSGGNLPFPGSRPTSALPQLRTFPSCNLYSHFRPTVAVHTRHSVLTLSATNCLSPVDNEQQLDALRGHYSTAP